MTIPEELQGTDGEQAKKVSQIELIKKTAYVMLGKNYGDKGWRPFPHQILIRRHQTEDPIFFELRKENVIVRISTRLIHATILSYWQQCPATVTKRLTINDARSTLDFFEALAPPFDEVIDPVLFASDIGYCFRRLPFDPVPGMTPTFDELLSRTSNARALMAWIGSLFDTKSERQQYLWIYGDGMNGKSSLAKFLQNIFADGAVSAQPPGRGGDRFWAAQFIGKRLVVLPDCNDYTFVNSGQFKSHTGGDKIPIEEKNKGIYCIDPTWKFLILSNQKPSIEGEASAVRRAIYCEMAPITKKRLTDGSYQFLLTREAPAIIAKCLEVYREMAPDGGAIETDAEITQELIDAAEERWAFIANRHLLFYEEATLSGVSYSEMPCVTRHHMRAIQKIENLSVGQYQSFLNYIHRKHGVRVHLVKVDGTPRRVYIKCQSRGGTHYADELSNGAPTSQATQKTTVHFMHKSDYDS